MRAPTTLCKGVKPAWPAHTHVDVQPPATHTKLVPITQCFNVQARAKTTCVSQHFMNRRLHTLLQSVHTCRITGVNPVQTTNTPGKKPAAECLSVTHQIKHQNQLPPSTQRRLCTPAVAATPAFTLAAQPSSPTIAVSAPRAQQGTAHTARQTAPQQHNRRQLLPQAA